MIAKKYDDDAYKQAVEAAEFISPELVKPKAQVYKEQEFTSCQIPSFVNSLLNVPGVDNCHASNQNTSNDFCVSENKRPD